ncbi:hypothetical protein D4764_0186700 [Takifugu flavidus]|uniref:Ig-like domain-containing protein n=1 Tax=Takifugu flavidus TaxID=433684 RepID=A0A5C6MFC6_9TELE|nr:hypothetical protein D4764_0186700 [Takifugu flavidus]
MNPVTKTTQLNQASVGASFQAAPLTASSRKPLTDGEFVKKCINAVAEVVCPEKKDVFNADQISRGNASLLLMWVKVEDQGPYMCYTSTDIDNSENIIELKVEALIRNVNIKQVNDTITCSSERIYPEPELSWSTNPPSPMRDPPEIQLMEDGLYKISSTIVKNSTALSYSCTVSAGRNKRKNFV